jgi:hypothetical protein
MTSQDAALENIDRLRTRIDRDEILVQLAEKRNLAVGPHKLIPSGVDLAACALAATVYRKDEGSVALALPRGQHGLAAIVGAYLARVQESRRHPGSVAVLTRSTSLRRIVADLRVPTKSLGDQIEVRKLGTILQPGGRVRPAAVSYLRSSDRKGVSQADHYLLFQLPHVAPPTAYNVISTVVVDTVASSSESWEQSWERNRRARRRQVWVGELGDPGFDAFCREREIPLFRFDWETISACATTFGCGSGPLTTAPLCNAAGGAIGPAFKVCNHARFNEELKQLNWRLAEIRKRAKPEPAEEKPAPFRAAVQLAGFFGRIAFPVEAFDAQATFAYSVRSSAYLLRRVEEAYGSAFRGRAWKDAFNSHWGAVKGAAKALREIATMECPKWWAVCVRVEEAHNAGEKLRIVCQTQADQAALAQSLVDENIVPPSAVGDAIEIVTFSERDYQGNEADGRVTLYLAPPPPWHASVYLTGERRRAEVLVYPTQVWQLRTAFARTWAASTNHAENATTLSRIGFGDAGAAQAKEAEPPALVELEQFTIDDTATTEDDYLDAAGNGHVHALMEEIVSLHGQDVDDEKVERGTRSPRGTTGTVAARRISFVEGPVLIVADDAWLDVVWTAGTLGAVKVIEKPPAELQTGNRVIVMPGSMRGSLLQELMAAWDKRLGPVRFAYQSLWQAALEAAAEKLGRAGLASRLDVTVGTVDAWLDPVKGSMWPQQKSWMREILDIARDTNEKAWENRAPIVRYIERTRGAHRVIGRLLNRAVTEAVTGVGTRWTRELEKRVGQTVEDQLAAAQFLTVKEVGALEQVPPRQIGLFIDPDDA